MSTFHLFSNENSNKIHDCLTITKTESKVYTSEIYYQGANYTEKPVKENTEILKKWGEIYY